MSHQILINLAVEDELSEHILRVALRQTGRDFLIGSVRGRQGNGFLKRMLPAFQSAARGSAYLVLTDLDAIPCAPSLIEEWFRSDLATYTVRRHSNLLFRVAVRESESWVMADREGFASFLGIALDHMPLEPDALADPKRTLLDLARRSRRRDLRDDIVPRLGDLRTIGPDYNGRLVEFLNTSWDASRAEVTSPSFKRAFNAMKRFRPVFPLPSRPAE